MSYVHILQSKNSFGGREGRKNGIGEGGEKRDVTTDEKTRTKSFFLSGDAV